MRVRYDASGARCPVQLRARFARGGRAIREVDGTDILRHHPALFRRSCVKRSRCALDDV